MEKIKFEDVHKSYNGKRGCMCGCLGDYKLPSADLIEEANRRVGYNGYSVDDVSPRSVKIALNKINKAIEQFGDLPQHVQEANEFYFNLEGPTKYVTIDINGRTTAVYLK